MVYADQVELVRTIGEFSVGALERGGAVVLLAARDQLAAADDWVTLSPSLLAAETPLLTDGRYQRFAVEDVIGELDSSPDPARTFERFLETACESVPAGADVVSVFGDLVGTLWGHGQTDLAVEIELLGGRFASESGMPVLCAYPGYVLATSADLQVVLGCHTDLVPRSVVPSPASRIGMPRPPSPPRPAESAPEGGRIIVARSKAFPASIPACRAARQFVRAAVEHATSDAEVIDAAELVCSELAANAVRHAHSAFTVRVVCNEHGVRVAVADEDGPSHGPSGGEEQVPFPVRAARGLGIVSALSDNWGVEEDAPGKTVWAELGLAAGRA